MVTYNGHGTTRGQASSNQKRCSICGLEVNDKDVFYAVGKGIRCADCFDIKRIQARNYKLPDGCWVNKYHYQKRIARENNEEFRYAKRRAPDDPPGEITSEMLMLEGLVPGT